MLDFIWEFFGFDDVYYDYEVAWLEWEFGFMNVVLVNFMKSYYNIKVLVEQVFDVYFYQCLVVMNCWELASVFLLFVNYGVYFCNGQCILIKSQAKCINVIMLICGFYDEAGEFVFCVGLLGKSGVGGGIVVVIFNELFIVVWSFELNEYGNLQVGIKVLEFFMMMIEMFIF